MPFRGKTIMLIQVLISLKKIIFNKIERLSESEFSFLNEDILND